MDKDVIAAMVLGDGYLEKHGRGIRLQIKHSQRFKEYVEWKHRMLNDLSPSPIYYGEAKYPFYRFVTKRHPYLEELYKKFYRNKIKIIPRDTKVFLNTPQALAVYFMDDATVDKRRGAVLFETQSFPDSQIIRLAKCLFANFNLQAVIHKSGRNRGKRLYLTVREAKKLREIIKPHILNCMKYKLLIPL